MLVFATLQPIVAISIFSVVATYVFLQLQATLQNQDATDNNKSSIKRLNTKVESIDAIAIQLQDAIGSLLQTSLEHQGLIDNTRNDISDLDARADNTDDKGKWNL